MKYGKLVEVIVIINFLFQQNIFYAQPRKVKMRFPDKHYIVQPGEQFSINMNVEIPSGWHINSNKPDNEFLLPSIVNAEGQGIELVEVQYPEAKILHLPIFNQLVSVYEGTEMFRLTIKVDKSAAQGKQVISVILNYQACNNETCLLPESVSSIVVIEIMPNDVNEKATDTKKKE